MAKELYRLSVSGNHVNEYWENVLFFEGDNLSAGDVIVNARDLISSWQSVAHGEFLAMLPGTVFINRLTACRQDLAGGIQIVHQYAPYTEGGTAGAAASSQQLCPIVRLIPPMGVKSAGRFFLPGVDEADIENNQPVAGWFTKLATLMGTLLGGFGSGSINWTQAIYSRKNESYALALSYDTSPIIGWQRKRQRPY